MAATTLPPTGAVPSVFGRLARSRRANERLFYGLIGFVVVLAIWELAGSLGLYRRSLLSSPSFIFS